MSQFICHNCPLTGTDLGSWDSEHPLFKSVLQVHKNHSGFGEGEIKPRKTVEDDFTKSMNENYHEMLHALIHSCKGPTKSCLIRGALDAI